MKCSLTIDPNRASNMTRDSPAGSFRYDRLVRSSVASNRGGLRRGGKISEADEVELDLSNVRVVFTVETCFERVLCQCRAP